MVYHYELETPIESKLVQDFKTYLSYVSAFFCYIAGAFILFNKELRRTKPYSMIALSLFSMGSLLQINFSHVQVIEWQILHMLEFGMFGGLH